MTQNRRQFIRNAASLAVLPLLPARLLRPLSPGVILYNANIITVNPAQPRANALAILGDRILAVGTNGDMHRLATGNTRKINLGGQTVTPGFIDAHSHPASAGLSHLRNVDCDLRSIKAIKAAIHERAQKTPPGEWVLGFKFDDTKTAEGRTLNVGDLDEAAPNHPVIITHRGGHTAYVNSKALRLAGYGRQTPDPKGGKLDRDPQTGELTGKLLETATYPLWVHIPKEATRQDRQAGVKLISKMMARTGLTSVHDTGGTPDALLSYQDAQHNDELGLRIYCMIGYRYLDEMLKAGIRTGLGDNMVRVGGMKLVCDGSLSERTAYISEPYVGRPNDHGILVMDEDELYQYAIKAQKADWQIGTHANGDWAIEKVLNVYERVQKEHPRPDPRFRIEHCSIVNDKLIARIKKLGAIPNPFSTYVYFHGEKMHEYGPERMEHTMAVRSFLDAGIRVTQTSDYTPGPFEPMMALQSSVTRTDMKGRTWGPSQKITVEEAIKVGTLHGTYASYEEAHKGSLEVGKLADLVVLGKDPLTTDPMDIVNITIERTMLGGRWVYES